MWLSFLKKTPIQSKAWFALYLFDHTTFHPTIQNDPRYLAFLNKYHHFLSSFSPSPAGESSRPKKQERVGRLFRQNPKVPRIVLVKTLKRDFFLQYCMDNQLFVQCHQILMHPEYNTFLQVDGITRLDIQSSLVKGTRENPNVLNHQHIYLGYGSRDESYIIGNNVSIQRWRLYLFGDFITDGSSIRKNTHLCASLFLQHYYTFKEVDAIQVYICLRTLLRWACVCRKRQKFMLEPSNPAFHLYRNIHTMIQLFELPQEFPTLVTAFCSFVMIEKPHFVTVSLFNNLKRYFQEQPSMKEVFPQVYYILQNLPKNRQLVQIEQNILSAAWFYAMVLHPHLPQQLRKQIFLEVHLQETLPVPKSFKGKKWMLKSPPQPRSNDIFVVFAQMLEARAFGIQGVPSIGGNDMAFEDLWFLRWPEYVGNDPLQLDCLYYELKKYI